MSALLLQVAVGLALGNAAARYARLATWGEAIDRTYFQFWALGLVAVGAYIKGML